MLTRNDSRPTGASSPLLAAAEAAVARHPVALPLLAYVLFTAIVSAIHGAEPPLSIDHIAYFKLADEIRAEYPNGGYWSTFNSVRGYGVLLALLHDYTGSHVASLKVILALITVAYLGAFQLFMGLTRATPFQRVLFSMLSALFVTFGASIWGMTDFAASLNRTIIIPFVVVLAWYFFRHYGSPRRYAVFPAFIALSLLHLSALHVFLVFCAFEALDFLVRRRFRLDRQLAWFVAAMAASVAMQGALETFAAGTSGYLRYTLNMTVPKLAAMLPARAEPPPTAAVIAATQEIRKAAEEVRLAEAEAAARRPSVATARAGRSQPASAAATVPDAEKRPAEGDSKVVVKEGELPRLSTQEAWRIELLAFPWRNFPPSVATLATIASSYGVIFLLAAWGAWRVRRASDWQALDLGMLLLGVASVMTAFGLQAVLWVLRSRIPVMPINFEEIRAINMVMIPSVYFVFRLFEFAPPLGRLAPGTVRVAVVAAFVLQPIVLVRALPSAAREGILQTAIDRGLVKRSDAPRMLYARQFLGLATDGRRYYYASRPVIDWLERHAGPDDRVLTNLNEFHMSRVKAIGPFLGIVSLDVWDVRRTKWADTLEAIDGALAARNLAAILELAREVGATFAVVDWRVEGAAYADENYSVVRVPPAAEKGTP